jgi:hypothetical protein
VSEQTLAIMRARNKAFRWRKGISGNSSGQSGHYHASRKLARNAAPLMMQELIRLATNAEDERVRSVCLIAVLDRAGVKPIDKPEPEPESKPAFDPRNFNERDLAVIEAALKLMVQGGSTPAEPELIPPGDR